ncbi:hypothetical protein LXA43DRAFT_970023 [Ganoderma leucocontextum]|nr:hypothetical protein LXA43DRAFT_970023 [Ganoderma leucocontextum]
MSPTSRIGNMFAVVAIGLIMYECTITFSQEVELFWRRKFTLSSVLFLVNRYVPLVVNMIFAPWPSNTNTSPTTPIILEIFQYLPWADTSYMDHPMFSGLRAYVLSSKTWPLAVLVFILSLAPVVINYVTLGYAVASIDPMFGCGVSSTLTDRVQQDFTIVSRVCLITSDLLVLAITQWTATYKNSKEMKLLGQSTSLSSILFRDGEQQPHCVLLIMNVLHLSFSLRSILNQNNADNASYITILTEPITAILISRFLIDLQEANNGKHHQHTLSSVQLGQTGTLDFNRVAGSLCSSLAAPGEMSSEQNLQNLDSDQSAAKGDGRSLGSDDKDPKRDSETFSREAVSSTVNPC